MKMNITIDKELGVVQDPLQQGIEEELFSPNLAEKHQEVTKLKEIPWDADENDVERDYEYQRKQFYNLVEKGSTAIDGILELAKEGEHPRGYEVAGNLIKQVAEVTEKLGDLQEKMKRLQDVPNSAPKNVTNALFVGSTAELQKLIKEKK